MKALRAVRSTFEKCSLAVVLAAVCLVPSRAEAQVQVFKLDRLEVAGAPDDTLMMQRAVTQPVPIFFGQVGIGYQLNPLKLTNIRSKEDIKGITNAHRGVVENMFSVYTAVGVQVFNRATFAVAFPFAPYQNGTDPQYPIGSSINANDTTTPGLITEGPTAGDVRLDARVVIWRSRNERASFGASGSLYAPTGTSNNFGADRIVTGSLGIQGEYAFKFPLVLMATTGVMFRPYAAINDPIVSSGLGIGDEWRFQLGGFIPIKDGKYRIGATIQGQTGIEANNSAGSIGNTGFTLRNTPIEWAVEGRAKFGPKDHWWVGLTAGSFILAGYGAPDFRVVGMLGVYVPILDTSSSSPDVKLALREKWKHQRSADSDGDGIPDDIDACPNDPEDHKGSDPSDGCPMPPDKDGDGIPDQFDKCPDVPEDKDGIDDGDGCPETDADNDGIPDTEDACPKEPGAKSPDPKKNGCPQFISMEGSIVKVLQQVHFATASATILPDSFPMLQEIANLLKANTTIKKMSIEGHTDSKGNPEMNKTLSQARANSVMGWLTGHGVETARLEAHGYGQEKPVETNDTDKGRQANRRVEFKITEQEDPNKVKK